ncbi:aspartate kinase [Candidatus Poribacteria bacterium]|nr:aspartate kinase [Candidatus Poribacteria bacterium]MEE2909835.1 aspartate kinase [Candidatus Poribacteria bacterium]|tara:strand:+ start:388 stop:1605 length:1218 start_codon:yes stop_codon:yes gene_type:complete
MSIIVKKFGGTSVGDTTKIKNVAKRIVGTIEKGNQVVVAVSAMGGTTDKLVALAHEVSPSPLERELDMLLSTGEQVSIALLAMAVSELGYEAISLTGNQVGILTDGFYSNARIVSINNQRIFDELKMGKVVILAGFQGVTIDGEITTLGRGASDTTAVAIAASLNADRCEIYTDVDGIYTADPRIVKSARKLDRITHDEMLEMAGLGAKVLHSRSVELAKKFQVPLMVRSSFHEGDGTIIVKESEIMEQVVVSGVTSNKDQAKISLIGIEDKPGVAAEIFNIVAEQNINIDMIIQNVGRDGTTDLSFTVPEKDLSKTVKVIQELNDQIKIATLETDSDISKVSVVGIGMVSHVGVASKMFSALAEQNINIQMISTSEIKISCVIDQTQTDKAVEVIHDSFDLGQA